MLLSAHKIETNNNGTEQFVQRMKGFDNQNENLRYLHVPEPRRIL